MRQNESLCSSVMIISMGRNFIPGGMLRPALLVALAKQQSQDSLLRSYTLRLSTPQSSPLSKSFIIQIASRSVGRPECATRSRPLMHAVRNDDSPQR